MNTQCDDELVDKIKHRGPFFLLLNEGDVACRQKENQRTKKRSRLIWWKFLKIFKKMRKTQQYANHQRGKKMRIEKCLTVCFLCFITINIDNLSAFLFKV